MTNQEKYLPLFNEDGSWIERPEYYLFARMGCEDEVSADDVGRVHAAMLSSDNDSSKLSRFDEDIKKRYVERNIPVRSQAGDVLLTLVRLMLDARTTPTLGKAFRLCALHREVEHPTTTAKSHRRLVERAFSKYRDTAHLQAALRLPDTDVKLLELSPEHGLRFLEHARWIEAKMDNYAARDPLARWNPWRVPQGIEARAPRHLPAMADDELAAVG